MNETTCPRVSVSYYPGKNSHKELKGLGQKEKKASARAVAGCTQAERTTLSLISLSLKASTRGEAEGGSP